MKPSLVSITAAAQSEIERVQKQYREKTGLESIPAIVWLDSAINPVLVTSGVGVGIYDESSREELRDEICQIDDFEYVIAVSEEVEVLFDGKILDYKSGFILL